MFCETFVIKDVWTTFLFRIEMIKFDYISPLQGIQNMDNLYLCIKQGL